MFASSMHDLALYVWLLICDMDSELPGVGRDLKYTIEILDHRPSRAASLWFLIYFSFLFTSDALSSCNVAAMH